MKKRDADAIYEEFLTTLATANASRAGFAERVVDLRWNERFRNTLFAAIARGMPEELALRLVTQGYFTFEQRPSLEALFEEYLEEHREKHVAAIDMEAAAAPDPAPRASGPVVQAEPPSLAEFFLSLLLSGDKGDALLGDLSERFGEDCDRYGAKRARRLYWAQTLRSLWPLLRRGAARVVKWGVVIDAVRRFF
jgi:hypothetical protein